MSTPAKPKAAASKKKAAATTTAAKPKAAAKHSVPSATLFERRPKNFGIGGDIRVKRDVTRFVRWPKYVKLQRQKRILYQRLKVPPALNQFTKALDKNHATALFKLFDKYKPETKQQKHARLLAAAKAKVDNKDAKVEPTRPPNVAKFGINHITALIEAKKAKLVVIAHDVDPIELVVWLPALCRKMGVPYVIVKSKARLGHIVHKKTATALALVNVNKEDANELAQLVTYARENYNDKYDDNRKQWGLGKLGTKSEAAAAKRRKAVQKELNVKAGTVKKGYFVKKTKKKNDRG